VSVQLLTVEEVAERLRVHPKTVRRMLARGELGRVTLGRAVRIREDELEQLVATNTARGAGGPRRPARALRPIEGRRSFVDRLRSQDGERAAG